MNELEKEIARANIALYDLGQDLEACNRQQDYGMADVITGEIKNLTAYLSGLRKAHELIELEVKE